MVKGYAAKEPGGKLEVLEYDLGPLGDHQVEVKVEYCGLCYTDISMIDNTLGVSFYPLVLGHEVIGTIKAVGSSVKGREIGQRVRVGWSSASCMSCEFCLSGDHNLCASNVPTVLGRYGGFAESLYAQAEWVSPISQELDPEAAGLLLCGGITVFNPLIKFNVKPTDHVGVIGIGGLGHLALKFLDAWGCEVTAFSSTPEKEVEAKKFGDDHFINSLDVDALSKVANSMDFIISTTYSPVDWSSYITVLRPRGWMVQIGIPFEPMQVSVLSLLISQKSVTGSPTGSPVTMASMLNFAARRMPGNQMLFSSLPMTSDGCSRVLMEVNITTFQI